MKKITSFAAAAFAALTLTVSGYAMEPETERPAIVFEQNTSSAEFRTQAEMSDNAGETDRLYLENTAIPENSEPTQTDNGSEKSFTPQDILKMIGISAVIGIIIALIVCLIMKSRMKTAVPKHTANDYIRKNSFNITRSRDIFIYSSITKKKRQKQENK